MGQDGESSNYEDAGSGALNLHSSPGLRPYQHRVSVEGPSGRPTPGGSACLYAQPPSICQVCTYCMPAPLEGPGDTGERPGLASTACERAKRQSGPRPWPESPQDAQTRRPETQCPLIRHPRYKDQSGGCPLELRQGDRDMSRPWESRGCRTVSQGRGGCWQARGSGGPVSQSRPGGGPGHGGSDPVQTPQPSSVWARPSQHSQCLLLRKWASPNRLSPRTSAGPMPLHTDTPVGKPICTESSQSADKSG